MKEFNANLRIKQLREALKITRDDFCLKLGFKSSQIGNIENNKQQTPAWILEKIAEEYPEYGYWLATGKEIPEVGQISPMTESTRQNLLKAG